MSNLRRWSWLPLRLAGSAVFAEEPQPLPTPFTTEDAPRRRPPACEIAPELLAEELQVLAASCRRQLERCVQSPDAGRLRRATALLATTADAAQLAAGLVQRPGEALSVLPL